MTLINRQRYMAELSKLLTFMYKEDRSEILQHYNELLDGAEDEEAMLESFGSPTRLAVTISRTYQRDDRKLSVRADSKTGETEDAPRPAAPVVRKPEEKQPTQSYAEIIEEIRREKAAEQGLEYTPMFFDEPEEKQEEPEPEPEQESAPEAEEEAETEDAPEAAETPEEETPAEDEPQEKSEAEADVPEEPSEAEDDVESEEEPAAEEAAESEADAENAESDGEEADEAEADEADESETQPEPEEPEEAEEAASDEAPAAPVRVRKTNAALLVLYLIFAIPIGLLLYVLLITLDLALLCVGLGVAASAVQTLSFAFSGMAVFADTILVFGAGLVAAAVALVLLWFAIWLSIKDIGALSRGIVALGRKICVREVEVNE